MENPTKQELSSKNTKQKQKLLNENEEKSQHIGQLIEKVNVDAANENYSKLNASQTVDTLKLDIAIYKTAIISLMMNKLIADSTVNVVFIDNPKVLIMLDNVMQSVVNDLPYIARNMKHEFCDNLNVFDVSEILMKIFLNDLPGIARSMNQDLNNMKYNVFPNGDEIHNETRKEKFSTTGCKENAIKTGQQLFSTKCPGTLKTNNYEKKQIIEQTLCKNGNTL